MSRWFLFFLIYSFFGYCLEKLFAYATHSPRQVRKCFLLLPLCPVYGLAMAAVTALSPSAENFLLSAAIGGAVCTLIEYLVHLFYDKVFRVRFWDYSSLRGNINGRVCPQFSLIWGILSAAAARFAHPFVTAAVSAVSPAAVFLLWTALVLDCILTTNVLTRFHDTEQLSLAAYFLSSGSPTNPERHGRRTDGSSR